MEIKEIFQNYPLSLLLQADPDIKKIEKYLNKGHCFAAYEAEKIIGAYVLQDLKNQTAEIMNIAVDEACRNKGVGRELIQDAVQKATEAGFTHLFIATGKDTFQQKFYESCGFNVVEIQKDYFLTAYKEPVIDNGKQLTDQVRLQKIL